MARVFPWQFPPRSQSVQTHCVHGRQPVPEVARLRLGTLCPGSSLGGGRHYVGHLSERSRGQLLVYAPFHVKQGHVGRPERGPNWLERESKSGSMPELAWKPLPWFGSANSRPRSAVGVGGVRAEGEAQGNCFSMDSTVIEQRRRPPDRLVLILSLEPTNPAISLDLIHRRVVWRLLLHIQCCQCRDRSGFPRVWTGDARCTSYTCRSKLGFVSQ